MKEASYYTKLKGNRIKCTLCPHNCIVNEGRRGICGVRINSEGILYSEVYGKPVAIHTDPVEKKPLYHFYPGTQVLSVGTLGCNLKCSFCQNCEISQAKAEDMQFELGKTINELVLLAEEKQKNIGLAYTYNEPVIFFEYMLDLAMEVHWRGLKNIMVSNGFINAGPLAELMQYIDAFNIDLKSFEPEFYKKHTHSRLEPVLDTIKTLSAGGKHLELTYLVIPGLNDNLAKFDEMLNWIIAETGNKTVLHISRYFPHFKMFLPPTPVKILEALYQHAKEKLDFVYLGNIQNLNGQDTFCPSCRSVVLKRNGYYTSNEGLEKDGRCRGCHEKIINFMEL